MTTHLENGRWRFEDNGQFFVKIDDKWVEMFRDEIEVIIAEKEGYTSRSSNNLMAVLDTTLVSDLVVEGKARELVSHVQHYRKELNLKYADKILLGIGFVPNDPDISTCLEIQQAILEHKNHICNEVLASKIVVYSDSNKPDIATKIIEIDGCKLYLSIDKSKWQWNKFAIIVQNFLYEFRYIMPRRFSRALKKLSRSNK